ncbi:MAG: acyl-CoA dehydrogenase family protein [Sphingorhabdus sp.]
MNFNLSDDQRMLKDSLDRLVAEPVTGAAINELGLYMLPFDEADGGLGLGAVEMMLVGEAFGKALVVEPYLGGVVLAGTALRLAPASPERADAITALASGEKRFAAITAQGADMVLGGDSADMFVHIDGDAVALVDAAAISRRSFRLHNGWGAASILLEGPGSVALGHVPGSTAKLEQQAIAWLSANAVGAMDAAFALTVDYLKTREQFGKPIGSNQALQHRVAEMLVELEAARSMAIYATQMIDEPDADERGRAFAAIKLVINKAARFIGQQVVQLHGGIGVAQEHDAGRYFKHLTVIEMLFGDSDHHADRLARLDGFTRASPHWS